MRRETDLERWDRNFHELLQELRIAQTSAQIVLAFVLALALADRFHVMTPLWRIVYIVTLTSATVSLILFLAPVSFHRILFRRGLKPRIVVVTARLARAGLGCALLAIVGMIFLVVYATTDLPTATALCIGIFLLALCLWYILPAHERRRRRGRQLAGAASSASPTVENANREVSASPRSPKQ